MVSFVEKNGLYLRPRLKRLQELQTEIFRQLQFMETRARAREPVHWMTLNRVKFRFWSLPISPHVAWTSINYPLSSILTCQMCLKTMFTASVALVGLEKRAKRFHW